MLYGMREVIIRVSAFWITFVLSKSQPTNGAWPGRRFGAASALAGPVPDDAVGRRDHDQAGRLLAFPDDSPGVFRRPTDERTFTPMMTEPARVVFEGGSR